jgi:hypothetical protein
VTVLSPVPNVVGLTQTQATAAITVASLVTGTETSMSNNRRPIG